MLHRIPSTTRRALAALALAILAAGALPALAQGPGAADDGPDIPGLAARGPAGDDDADFEPGFPPRLARRLDLTDAQQDAIAKIFAAGRARDLPLRKQVRRLRNDLQGEMMKDEPSEAAVLALARQIGDMRTQLQAGRLQDRLAMRRHLTPGQRDQLIMFGAERGGFGHGGRLGAFLRGGPGRGWRGFDGGERPGAGRGFRDGGRRLHQQQPDRTTD